MPNHPHKEAVKSLSLWIFSSPFYLSIHFRTLSCHHFQVQYTKLNQVYDGSFSDTLHTTLFLKDPLRGWCEENISRSNSYFFFFSVERRPVKRNIYYIKLLLSLQSGFFSVLIPAKAVPNERLKFHHQVSEQYCMQLSDCMVGKGARSEQNPV